ncbi:aspartate kinase [Bacillaceae bacterium S4-13-56]
MNIVVQKFGGTSVKDKEGRAHAIHHIKNALKEYDKVVVVVSAMGRKGNPYSTDTLLSLIDYPNTTVTSRELDLMMSCGETISSIVFTHECQQAGINATALTGAQAGIRTSADYTEAKIKEINTERLLGELTTKDVVVVAGFQGQAKNGDTTTIGRGGSDTTAAALGSALNANSVDIFTDVKGIMTADPRIVDSARQLDVVTYNEISNLAYQGAKVVHPRAVEIAMHGKIPLRIRSTYSDDKGTLVTDIRESITGRDIPDRLVTGIAHLPGITQVKVQAKKGGYQLQSDVFKSMAEAGISVDFINISPQGVIYTIPEKNTDKALSILDALGYDVEIIRNCAKISAVGAGMTGVPGVTAKIVQCLIDAEIQILQSADSHTTIWVLVREEDLVSAVNTLHQAFELNKEKEVSRT